MVFVFCLAGALLVRLFIFFGCGTSALAVRMRCRCANSVNLCPGFGQGQFASTLGRLSGGENHVFGAPERCVTAMFNSRTSSQEDRVLRPFEGISEGFRSSSERCVPAMSELLRASARAGPRRSAILLNIAWDILDEMYIGYTHGRCLFSCAILPLEFSVALFRLFICVCFFVL